MKSILTKDEIDKASFGPRDSKDPRSKDFAIQTLHALQRYAESLQCDRKLVQQEINTVTQYEHWKILGYSSRNAMFRAELSAIALARVKAMTKNMARHGEIGNGRRGDNITSTRGTDPAYLARRLKRDHPEIFARLETYPSVRAAAIEAGIIKVPTALEQLQKAWKKLTTHERDQFLTWIKGVK